MRKKLCGRNTYEGIKNVLESYVDKEHRFVKDESWIDFYSCENRVFIPEGQEKKFIYMCGKSV